MKNKFLLKIFNTLKSLNFWLVLVLFFVSLFWFLNFFGNRVSYKSGQLKEDLKDNKKEEDRISNTFFDTKTYDEKMLLLANNPPDPIIYKTIKMTEKDSKGKIITKVTKEPLSPQPIAKHLWPIKTVYPNPGAILPFNRIIAYYGNLYSKNMGVLGQYEEDKMLSMLQAEVKKWNDADPSTPAIPALHYIATVAQGAAGRDGKYRARMPDTQIEKLLKIAEKSKALVFLDIQVGLSNVESEIPVLEKYLKLSHVHLGIDPEFSMKTGARPGKVIGTFDAVDINFAINYLTKIVKENNLPPKILVIHRFTQGMVTNYQKIKPTKEVQVIMDMDGWGEQAKKIGTYKQFIYKEPVQFTGFKLFYKNDTIRSNSTMLTPESILKLNPRPIYIQYQ